MVVDKSLVSSVLLLLLQTHSCWGQSQMIVPSQPIIATVGSDVTLPCEVDPVKNIEDLVVEWARPDLKPRHVHIRREGVDLLINQNSYQGRTRLLERGLQCGDMSLQLSRVRLSDGGTYRCFLPQIGTAGEVTLHVVSVSPVSVSLTKDHSGSPVLRCESGGWYPEPELLWLDSDGTVLTGGRTQDISSRDETFSVSSRLSVEQNPGNTFICRVRHQETRQSTEAHITITGEFLEACACAVAWTLFGLALCLAAAAAGAFVVWKYKIQKTENVKSEESASMLQSAIKAHCYEQKLTENREALLRITEELDFIEESEKLSGTKELLLKLKDVLQRCDYDLSADIKEKREKIKESMFSTERNKKRERKIEKHKSQMTIFRDIIDLTEREIVKIDELVRKSTERHGKLKAEYELMKKQLGNKRRSVKAASQPEPEEDEVKVDVPEENPKATDHMEEALDKE